MCSITVILKLHIKNEEQKSWWNGAKEMVTENTVIYIILKI